jgi:GntR family transcriptional regulator
VEGTVAADLGLEEGALAYRVERLRLADDEPMCVETVVVPADTFPRLLACDLTGGLYELFETRYNVSIVTAQQSVSALRATDESSELLAIEPGDPVLSVFRIGFDARGRAVERTVSLYRADRYEFLLFARR